jgi:hypothetical protein
MLNPIRSLLEKLAERCISTVAGMLATTISSMQISHHAQQQQQLEELAKDLEGQGLTEVAHSIREQAHLLTIEGPNQGPSVSSAFTPQEGVIGTNGAALPSRRPGRRARRSEGSSDVHETPSETSADSSLFFPLNAEPGNHSGGKEQP